MMPIEDENPTFATPWITYLLIAANLFVFLAELALLSSGKLEAFLSNYGLVAANVTAGKALYSLITSMFIHVGFMHFLGNMLFLYIFGNNIEDLFGRKHFILFYFGCGISASLFQIASDPASEIPTLGASGAVSGILAAYLYFYPKATVKTVFLIGFPINVIYHLFRGFARFPAYILIGLWFIVQFFPMEGVAYAAHISGFLVGLLLTRYMSLDVDLARKKQEIREKICARKIRGVKGSGSGAANIHRMLELVASEGEISLGAAAERLGLTGREILEYLGCVKSEGYVLLEGDPPDPLLKPTEKCLREYGE